MHVAAMDRKSVSCVINAVDFYVQRGHNHGMSQSQHVKCAVRLAGRLHLLVAS